MSHQVVLYLQHSRSTEGADVGKLLRRHLGEDADIEPVMDDTGGVSGYKLNMWFPTAGAAFDAALALRNWMAGEDWSCVVE